MEKIKNVLKSFFTFINAFVKWIVIAVIVGAVGGVIGSFFHISIDYVTSLREQNFWLVFLLPLAGVVITFLYGIFKNKGNMDTNRIIEAVSEEKSVPLIMSPLIIIGTVITHLCGGSAGREGAALQLGGSIGYNVGRICRLNAVDLRIVVMVGMSAVFAALFGTPVTAAIFAIEVICVGKMYYTALMPCLISSTTAYCVAFFVFRISPVVFKLPYVDFANSWIFVKVIILAALCALVSIIFCVLISYCEKYMKKFICNSYLRGVIGGVIIILLTFLVKSTDYNGAGMNMVELAINGNAKYEAFLLKILFTVITVAAGFKGGEIVPSFFIGSTFGCVVSFLLGINPGFGAAIGLIAVFCGVTNCPLASVFLAYELFGHQSILLFAVAVGVCFMLSGHVSLYKSQKIVFSKTSGENIEVSDIDL